MREMRKSRDRKIFGVAAGMAEYFDMDKTLWRAIWLVTCIFVFPAVLAYIILAIVMPPAPAAVEPPEFRSPEFQSPEFQNPESQGPADVPPRRAYRRLTKSYDRWLFGVAGGIADYFEIDPLVVRALFLASLFLFGTGVVLYLVLAILMPRPQYQYR